MLNKTILITLSLAIALLGVWSLSRVNSNHVSVANRVESQATIENNNIQTTITRKKINKSNAVSTAIIPSRGVDLSWADQVLTQIQENLNNNRWNEAVRQIDDNYSQAKARDLARFKATILQHSEMLIKGNAEGAASELLLTFVETFDEIDAWRRLSTLSAKNHQWDIAVDALLRLSAQQVDPINYQTTLKSLVKASSHVRSGLENRDDKLGILALYQRIYDQHPDYPRFQLELAQSHLRLNNIIAARPYLETLQYDPELGTLAKQKLASIDARLNATVKPEQLATTPKVSNPPEQIVVPLLRSGNSYLIDVSIKTRPMRLLLDTGASITSLSSDAIQRLDLKPTGRTINLNTANGLTKAQLYFADSMNLGRLRLNNLVVAEVDFGGNSRLHGLLGTDVLNQMKDRFSYIIDNQKNALIFQTK